MGKKQETLYNETLEKNHNSDYINSKDCVSISLCYCNVYKAIIC